MNIASMPRRRANLPLRPLLLALTALAFAGGARAQDHTGHAAATSQDPRVGLRGGMFDAAQASLNLTLVGTVPKPAGFFNPADAGDFGFMNADLAFSGKNLFLGGFAGIQVWNVADPARPTLRVAIDCPGGQGDVSVHGNLLFMSVEETRGRLDCGGQGVSTPVSAERFLGVRIFDISNLDRPTQIAAVQTCRGSHTHTLLVDPDDKENVYVYVSGSAPVRSSEELAGCVQAPPSADPNSALFRIEVIKVPLANPERAAIVSSPRIFDGLTEPEQHGATPAERAAASAQAAAARAAGMFTVMIRGQEVVVPPQAAAQMLEGMTRQRGGTGAPTAADSTALRAALPGIIAQRFPEPTPGETRPGPTQCHDITVYPAIGLAGGACEGYGLLLDIRDPVNPVRIAAVADSNFAYWHSATFNNDGTKVVFTDEWGGGTQAKCRTTDRAEWGANAIFTVADREMQFRSYYKIPAAQTAQENCVAHNGSLIPVPGRDVMVQAWYQGGVSVFDFTDAANPFEIAYFDRGPIDSTKMVMGGYWSTYWHDGHIYASEIGRGLDVFRLTPSEHLSANEIAAAERWAEPVANAQQQTKLGWPASVSVARAYLDQLVRARAIAPAQATRITAGLNRAERSGTPAQKRAAATALADAARGLTAGAAPATPGTPDRARLLATTLQELGGTMR